MNSSPGTDPERYPATPRRHVPLALVLVGGITMLILLSVGSVLFISLRGATENTFALLADKADANLDLLEQRLAGRLAPVVAAGTELSTLIGDNGYHADEARDQLRQTLRGALLSLPKGTATLFIRADSTAVRFAWLDGEIREIADNPDLIERQLLGLRRAFTMDSPAWVEPIWLPLLREPILSFVAPVRQEGSFLGAVIVSTRLGELAEFLANLEEEAGARAFVLYDRKFVLSHPDLLRHTAKLAADGNNVALPAIDSFDEAAFRLLDKDVQRAEALMEMSRVDDAPVDDEFILLIRDNETYGPAPWQIGLRFRQSDVSGEIERLWAAGASGLVILLVAVAIGYLFTRNLNRQIGRLAATAEKLRNLDVANLPPLPDSRLRELSNAASAFNALIAAMQWFETYVPKTLVLRLMRLGDGALQSNERDLTIMFTDMRGFSTLVEHMSPAETADFLNSHFALLAACIEAEGGTVDKFIGDALMAFWGAPEEQEDHAARALRAALAIDRAISADNLHNRAAGRPTIAIRIGVHTGPVVVGNIGAKNRLNYTVIGDAVNIAARLEAFAKDLGLDADCITLVSSTTLDAAGEMLPADATVEHLGDVPVRGRAGKVDAHRLTAGTS